MDALKRLDFYPKLNDEVKVKTFSGATISIISTIVMIVLFISQLSSYLTNETVERLTVDSETSGLLRVSYDITMNIPCELVSLAIKDATGSVQTDIDHVITFENISRGNKLTSEKYKIGNSVPFSPFTPTYTTKFVNSCTSCMDGDNSGKCCSSCSDVKDRYHKKQWKLPSLATIPQCTTEFISDLHSRVISGAQCRVFGYHKVPRVSGSLSLSAGWESELARRVTSFTGECSKKTPNSLCVLMNDIVNKINTGHTINNVKFGDDYDGLFNPLQNVDKSVDNGVHLSYLYYAKVVPTSYHPTTESEASSHINTNDRRLIQTNQYSVTEHVRQVPSAKELVKFSSSTNEGIFLFYELSPIRVNIYQKDKSFLSFLTHICAIIGGVFTVAGVVDKIIFTFGHSRNAYELGKMK